MRTAGISCWIRTGTTQRRRHWVQSSTTRQTTRTSASVSGSTCTGRVWAIWKSSAERTVRSSDIRVTFTFCSPVFLFDFDSWGRGVNRQFEHFQRKSPGTLMTLEISLLTFHSNVRIGSLTLQLYVPTEVEDLRVLNYLVSPHVASLKPQVQLTFVPPVRINRGHLLCFCPSQRRRRLCRAPANGARRR